ncbi:MAG: transporter substrate-binding domain-containing protein, partial [Pseudomonadota bacterium]
VDASLSEMNFTHLLDGQIDGFLEHPPVATAIKRRRGESDLIAPTTLEMGGGPVQFMFSRQTVDVDVVDRFNAALQTIIDSGEHQRMIDRYME